ncbi:MAG TPA: thioredoxin family protein [Kiritimatiellia bacterium]|nr:thioredoxin family protein [Kiritimatiellia bacterium]HMO98538.1 thioredoxin family protein [Kiritimatiellia bacterium]HMP96976.1 thioredoxin family protein [Kiritimatiellia bacterium]
MKHIQVLGPGCPKCKTLYANAEAAIQRAGIEAKLEKVESITEIMKSGVLMTPGLIVDGQIKSTGKVLTPDQIAAFLA